VGADKAGATQNQNGVFHGLTVTRCAKYVPTEIITSPSLAPLNHE
jgi:hypothetical protein